MLQKKKKDHPVSNSDNKPRSRVGHWGRFRGTEMKPCTSSSLPLIHSHRFVADLYFLICVIFDVLYVPPLSYDRLIALQSFTCTVLNEGGQHVNSPFTSSFIPFTNPSCSCPLLIPIVQPPFLLLVSKTITADSIKICCATNFI
jgi:hypothetical protein